MNKWWIYQKERFPLFGHGPLVLAFSLSALCFSSLLRGSDHFPMVSAIGVAFVSSLFSFLHLRIADEFKDFEEDCRYRPYRPVPRGLVTLKELGGIWVGTALIQFGMAIWLHPKLVFFLFLPWIYLSLMSKEFFAREWLKARPFTYMWTHMLIMPLIDFYATACDWVIAGEGIPKGLFWFVIVSFFNGFVIEIGRKIRSPEQEEQGVETYTAIWGRKVAVSLWILAMGLTGVSAVFAARLIDFTLPVCVTLGLIGFLGVGISIKFLRDPSGSWSSKFESVSGIWTLTLYLVLGAIPMTLHIIGNY